MFILASMGYFLYRWGAQYALFLTRPATRYVGRASVVANDLDRSLGPAEEGPLSAFMLPEDEDAEIAPNRDRGVSSAVHAFSSAVPERQPTVAASPRNSALSPNRRAASAASVVDSIVINPNNSSGPNAPHSPSSTLHYGRSPRWSEISNSSGSGSNVKSPSSMAANKGSDSDKNGDVEMENKAAEPTSPTPDPHLFLASRQWPWWYNVLFYLIPFAVTLHLNLVYTSFIFFPCTFDTHH
jgi:hypothetical protein